MSQAFRSTLPTATPAQTRNRPQLTERLYQKKFKFLLPDTCPYENAYTNVSSKYISSSTGIENFLEQKLQQKNETHFDVPLNSRILKHVLDADKTLVMDVKKDFNFNRTLLDHLVYFLNQAETTATLRSIDINEAVHAQMQPVSITENRDLKFVDNVVFTTANSNCYHIDVLLEFDKRGNEEGWPFSEAWFVDRLDTLPYTRYITEKHVRLSKGKAPISSEASEGEAPNSSGSQMLPTFNCTVLRTHEWTVTTYRDDVFDTCRVLDLAQCDYLTQLVEELRTQENMTNDITNKNMASNLNIINGFKHEESHFESNEHMSHLLACFRVSNHIRAGTPFYYSLPALNKKKADRLKTAKDVGIRHTFLNDDTISKKQFKSVQYTSKNGNLLDLKYQLRIKNFQDSPYIVIQGALRREGTSTKKSYPLVTPSDVYLDCVEQNNIIYFLHEVSQRSFVYDIEGRHVPQWVPESLLMPQPNTNTHLRLRTNLETKLKKKARIVLSDNWFLQPGAFEAEKHKQVFKNSTILSSNISPSQKKFNAPLTSHHPYVSSMQQNTHTAAVFGTYRLESTLLNAADFLSRNLKLTGNTGQDWNMVPMVATGKPDETHTNMLSRINQGNKNDASQQQLYMQTSADDNYRIFDEIQMYVRKKPLNVMIEDRLAKPAISPTFPQSCVAIVVRKGKTIVGCAVLLNAMEETVRLHYNFTSMPRNCFFLAFCKYTSNSVLHILNNQIQICCDAKRIPVLFFPVSSIVWLVYTTPKKKPNALAQIENKLDLMNTIRAGNARFVRLHFEYFKSLLMYGISTSDQQSLRVLSSCQSVGAALRCINALGYRHFDGNKLSTTKNAGTDCVLFKIHKDSLANGYVIESEATYCTCLMVKPNCIFLSGHQSHLTLRDTPNHTEHRSSSLSRALIRWWSDA